MDKRFFRCLLVAGLLGSAGCSSLSSRPDPGAPAPGAETSPAPLPSLAEELARTEQAIKETRATQVQSESDLYQLRLTIQQTAQSLKKIKDFTDAWDHELLTNRAALLIMEDHARELKRRADALATSGIATPVVPTPAPAAAPIATAPSAPTSDPKVTAFKLIAEGNIALQKGDLGKAQRRFEEAAERDPALVGARLGLAACAYQRDDLKEARRLIREVLDQDASNAQALGLRSMLNWKDGKLSAALKDGTQAVALAPDDAQLHKFLGIVLHANQKTAEAIEEMSQAVDLDPADGESLLNLAILLVSQPTPALEEARSHYEAALKLGQPREPNLDALLYPAKD